MALPTAPLSFRKCLVGAALETTNGTSNLASVLTPLSNTLTYNAKLVPEGLLDGGERRPDGHYGGEILSVPTQRIGRLTFTTECRNGDATPTLLRGCAFDTSSPYTPVTTIASHESLSMKLWQDGVMHALVGAMGKVTFRITRGERVMADWEFIGVWQAPTAVAMPPLAPVTSVTKFLSAATTHTLGGAIMPLCQSVEIDVDNPLSMRADLQSVGGNLHARIDASQRRVTIKIDPEGHLLADFDPFTTLLSGASAAYVLSVSDGTNTMSWTAAAAQKRSIDKDQRDGALVRPMELACCASSGDDEISIVAT